MIKPFEILKEDAADGGTLILYKVWKSVQKDRETIIKTTATSTIFVANGLNVEEELVTHLKAGNWL
tara:strand:- start:563 stop:760 length:198 start_codon:yes stop_codon:yes gene_type:complete